MDQGTAAIIVAAITTLGGIVVGFLQSVRKMQRSAVEENRQDHAVVQKQLGMIYRQVTRLDDKIEKHLDHHREGKKDGITKG
jgi:hypothetical protein